MRKKRLIGFFKNKIKNINNINNIYINYKLYFLI